MGIGRERRQRERWGIDRARVWLRWAAGMGLRAAANRRPKWPAGGVSPLFLWQKRNREKEKKERVRERICACGQFSRTHKNALDPGKIEVA